MKHYALASLKYTAAAADVVTPNRRGIPFLIYHRVGARSDSQIDLPPATFAAQMEALATAGRAIDIDTALDHLAAPRMPALDPVVVTFDDGTADWVDDVTPVLEKYKVPATFYVATDFVEGQRPFPGGGTPVSWAGLRDMLTTGLVTVGSHTHTHALLDRLPAPEVEAELARSCELIEDRLGVEAAHFAYPKALAGSPAADAAVRRRFRSAALSGCRANRYGSTDPYRLNRSPIQLADGMRWFTRKAAGGMQLEDAVRNLVNRRRYAGAEA